MKAAATAATGKARKADPWLPQAATVRGRVAMKGVVVRMGCEECRQGRMHLHPSG
jgi:hypothetical protein